MNQYEITYLIDPTLEDDARGQVDVAVDSLITEAEGKTGYSSPTTPRRLAYPVKSQATAFLRVVQTEVDPAKIQGIREALTKQSGVVRFTILNTPRRPEVPAEIVEKYGRSRGKKGATPTRVAPAPQKPLKPVTMEAVEKGIEEALSEEVK